MRTNMYTIKYTDISEIVSLRSEWEHLEQGDDMTYFQRYNWNLILANLQQPVNKNIIQFFATIMDGNKAVMIAPISIVKRGRWLKNEAVLFGGGGWSDYMNFVYTKFDAGALKFLFQNIKKRYAVKRFHFECMPESSQIYRYLKSNYIYINENHGICVSLRIPTDEASYMKLLSKNSRQNIRTAINRAAKDGVEFTYNFCDTTIDLQQFIHYRDVRTEERADKQRPSLFVKLRFIIKNIATHLLLQKTTLPALQYAPFIHDSHSRFMSITDTNGNLCAAFNYAPDPKHGSIALMAAATNPKFYKYSPGILLLYHYIIQQIEEGTLRILDFTRGNEKYKYALGGQEHYVSTFDINI